MGAVRIPRAGHEFDSFLYASVGDDDNGMPLTVLSVLARMDVDPWQEAAKLMQMPQGAAVEQLESLLGATRNTSRANHDPARIAAVLVALLPRPVNRVHPLLRDLAQARPTKSPDRVSTSTLLSVLAYMTLMLLSNWLMGNLQASRQRQAESAANSASTMDASATQEMTSKMSGPK